MSKRMILAVSVVSALAAAAQVQDPQAYVRCGDVEVVDGELWVATGARVVKIEKATGAQTEFVIDEVNENGQFTVNNIAAHGGDDIWFSCSMAVAAHYDGAEFTVENGLQAPASKRCSRVAVDGDGNPWASTGVGGIWGLDGGVWSQDYPYGGEGVGMYYTTGMAFDSEGLLWWTGSMIADGLGYCSPKDGWQSVTGQDNELMEAFAGFQFVSLAIDETGTKWMGLNWPAVAAYHKDGTWERIELVTEFEDGVDYAYNAYDAQVGPDGRVWVAYKQSLFAINADKTVEELKIPLDADAGVITCFKHDGDVIWIGTSKGWLCKWDGTAVEHFNLSAGVESVAADIESDDTPTYDIYGRRVERTLPGNIYIRGGRKFVEVR